jgi:hypothetical protein
MLSDLSAIASDLPTLLGVSTGIFVLAGLICMVLHLFSKTKYPRTRSFADAHSGPPVFFASDTGEIAISFHTFSHFTFIYIFRNTFDNTIESAFIEIESALIRLNRIVHETLVGHIAFERH